MNKQTFYDNRQRRVLIEITEKHIVFFDSDNLDRQAKWVEQQIEDGYEVSEEDKAIDEFYWVSIDDWNKDKTERKERGDNWHNHMNDKAWFTNEMYEWINRNT
jgi:hypothetical protein